MLQSLQLIQPTTVRDASQALADYGEKAKIYAGGAELLLLLRNGLLQSEVLVDVKKIARLHRVELDDGVLRIGACMTHHALETSKLVREHAPVLAYAESQVANIRVRNQGTLGGNLAFNDPHSDPGTVLLIHNASVLVGNDKDERRMALDDFFVDMYLTALGPGDLLLEIEIPALPAGMTSAYQRLHRYQRPTLGVAVGARMSNEAVEDIRLAVGCVGPIAQRLTELEAKITGTKPAEAKRIVAEAKNYLRGLLRPVDDLLGSADYKLYMTGVMLVDALEQVAREENGRN
ncbi:MAG TPA: FAD binding domain-containing protein [Candidatus Saccharimonadales bacterium]|nr:FAD binding domain-containing protein [Candidatus Saccharimonadales bacterium]